MTSPTKIFLAGIFVALLLFKPTFGAALLESLGSVTNAAFTTDQQRQTDPPVDNQVVDKELELKEEIISVSPNQLDLVFEAITKIIKRLDAVEYRSTQPSAPAEAAPAETEKQIAYKRALEEQGALERAAKYDGGDPVVRARLGLPSKVPPFDLFMVNDTMEASQFEKEFAKKLARIQ